MNRVVLCILAAGAVVILATAWLSFPRRHKPAGDPSHYRFMHCPQCKRESMYNPAGIDQPCMYCDRPLVATTESIKRLGASSSPFGRMIALLLVEANCLLGLVVFVLYHPPPPSEEEFYYVTCPKLTCKRRMRYPARRAGAEARCPLCKTTFINSSIDEQPGA